MMLTNQLARGVHRAGIFLIIGLVIWCILLVKGAQHVRDKTPATPRIVAFGPLILNEIKQSRNPASPSSISFEKDLIIYLAIWGLLGSIWELTVPRFRRRRLLQSRDP